MTSPAELDGFMAATGGANRSEVIRDLVRRGLSSRPEAPVNASCYGVISCAVDQSVRNLSSRVPQSRLDHHDQTIAALSVPLDHSTSIEVTVMKGRVADVQHFAEGLFLERGVVHGTLGPHPGDAGQDDAPCAQPRWRPTARTLPHQGAEQLRRAARL